MGLFKSRLVAFPVANSKKSNCIYRQLESIGYTKDQGERPDVLDILSKVGMDPQHRQQLEQRIREQVSTVKTRD